MANTKKSKDTVLINATAWRANLELGGLLPDNYNKPIKKKKYREGGGMNPDTASTAGALAGPLSGVINSGMETFWKDDPNDLEVNKAKNTTQGAISGAATGLAIGTNPLLMAATLGNSAWIAPTIGAIAGGTSQYMKSNKEQDKLDDIAEERYKEQLYSPITFENNFELGGMMNLLPGTGKPGVGDIVDINGPSHEQGGIPMGENAEVEGGEVKVDDYIFSDTLKVPNTNKTFADMAKNVRKKYDGRGDNDGPSKRSRDSEILTLMQLNEVERVKEEQNQAVQEQALQQEFAKFGGFIDLNDEGSLVIDSSMEEEFNSIAEQKGMTPGKYATELYRCGGRLRKQHQNGGMIEYATGGFLPKTQEEYNKPFYPTPTGEEVNPLDSLLYQQQQMEIIPNIFMGTKYRPNGKVRKEFPTDTSYPTADYTDFPSGEGFFIKDDIMSPNGIDNPYFYNEKRDPINNMDVNPNKEFIKNMSFNIGNTQEIPKETSQKDSILNNSKDANTFRQNNIASNSRMDLLGDQAFILSPEEAGNYMNNGRGGYDKDEILQVFPNGIPANLTDKEFNAEMEFANKKFQQDKPYVFGDNKDTTTSSSSGYEPILDDNGKLQSQLGKQNFNMGEEELALLASNLPALSNLLKSTKSEITKYPEIKFDEISLDKERQLIERQAAKEKAIARQNVRGSRSGADALSVNASVSSAIADSLMGKTLESLIKEDTTNVGIRNQAKQINQQTKINEITANEQNRAMAESTGNLALSDLGMNTQGYLKDKKANKIQDKKNTQMASLLKDIAADYTYEELPDGSYKIIPKGKKSAKETEEYFEKDKSKDNKSK